jgi:hypothetical protein
VLGISAFDGRLLHRQGHFPLHGFVEVSPEVVSGIVAPEVIQKIVIDLD